MEGFANLVLDAVFPKRCVACGADGEWCCAPCLSAIELVRANQQDDALDGLVIVGYYHDPRLRAAIRGLKYHDATCLAPSIAQLLDRFKLERRDPWPWAGESTLALQAVVGSPARVRARGFDQAEIIRDIVKERLVPWGNVTSLLARRSSSMAQADLEAGPLRTANVHDAFHITAGAHIPKSIILVDDVYTTGATMREAARGLRSAGVLRIYGFALAIGA